MAATQQILDDILEGYDLPIVHEVGLEFIPKCHPKVGVTAKYRCGVVTLQCQKCGSFVFDFAVAKDNKGIEV